MLRHAVHRRCVTALLPPHLNPLWTCSTRLCLTPILAVANHQQAPASTLAASPTTKKKSRKRAATTSIEKTVQTSESGITTKSKQTVVKTSPNAKRKTAKRKDEPAAATPPSVVAPKRRGRPPKSALLAPVVIEAPVTRERKATPRNVPLTGRNAAVFPKDSTAHRKRNKLRKAKVAPRVAYLAPTNKHHDLATFLKWTENTKTSTISNVWKGTNFEYLSVEVLKPLKFELQRVGRADDRGIDLIGYWNLPFAPAKVKVLVQCKVSAPTAAMMRELEGARPGAPAEFTGDDVISFLASTKPAKQGTREAMQRSRVPEGFIQISLDGTIQQFTWNAAADALLSGMTANKTYGAAIAKPLGGNLEVEGLKTGVSLHWMGKPLTTS